MPKQLLLADDSITIQKVVAITFANEDFRITSVSNGEDAVAKARTLKPDIILADVVMPKLNGYEVCEAIKNDPALKHIPVLLLAGTFEAFDEGRARTAAADGHIVKPFDSGKLIDHVKNLINGKGMQPAAAAPVPQVQPAAASIPAAPRPPIAAPPAAFPAPAAVARPTGLPPPPAGLRPPGAVPPAGGLAPPGGLRPPAGLPPPPAGLRPPGGLVPPAGLRPPSAGLQPPAGLKPPAPAPFQPPAGLRPPAPLGAPAPLAAPQPMAPPLGMGSSAIPAAPPSAAPKAQRDPFGLGLTIPTPRAPEPTVEAKPPAPPPRAPPSVMMAPAMPEEDILFEDPSVEPVKATPPPPPPSESELDFSSLNDVPAKPSAPVQAKPPSKSVPAFEPAHEPEISFDEEEVVAGEVVVEPPPAPPQPPKAVEPPRPAALAPTSPSLPSMQVRAPVPPTFTPAPGSSDAQLEATLRDALSRASKEMIERIAWEVVPQLAEAMIKAELERLMKDRQS